MYIVTGGAGFVGSNIVAGLNDRGLSNVIVVDDLEDEVKVSNIIDLDFSDYLDKSQFLKDVVKNGLPQQTRMVFHQGACSDTTVTDGHFMMENNFSYSKYLYEACRRCDVPFVYASSASVYGESKVFEELSECENPLNVYALSKLIFDRYVRAREASCTNQVVGLRYFNVYGAREQHKAHMASVAYQLFHQYQATGQVRLFGASGGYGDGEQRRDFVSIDDVVSANLFCMDHPDFKGIFNLGTGVSRSFNDIGLAVVNSCRTISGSKSLCLEECQTQEIISYFDMPATLTGKYQDYTQADVGRLREAGYDRKFTALEAGVRRYVDWLRQHVHSDPSQSDPT
jgi:ADP-L-glycero-D-manno-heptose 6-epimerase